MWPNKSLKTLIIAAERASRLLCLAVIAIPSLLSISSQNRPSAANDSQERNVFHTPNEITP